VMSDRSVFPVWNNGPVASARSVVIDVHHNGEGGVNLAMQRVHEAAFAAITPLVRPDCEFSWGDWSGENFRAHLTLAMADRRTGVWLKWPNLPWPNRLAHGPSWPSTFTCMHSKATIGRANGGTPCRGSGCTHGVCRVSATGGDRCPVRGGKSSAHRV
jgi:hypothetical protein